MMALPTEGLGDFLVFFLLGMLIGLPIKTGTEYSSGNCDFVLLECNPKEQ